MVYFVQIGRRFCGDMCDFHSFLEGMRQNSVKVEGANTCEKRLG